MRQPTHRRAGLFGSGAALAFVQAIVVGLKPHATLFSNSAISIGVLLAAVACMDEARRSPKEVRRLWFLVGTAFFISMVGQIAATYHEEVTSSAIQTTAFNFDFLFFVYGIPLLLAISSGEETLRFKAFLWMDGAQALVGATLAYLEIFSSLPSFAGSTPVTASSMFLLYSAENWILVGAATTRLFSNANPASKKFYKVLTIYLWTYALIATAMGYLELVRKISDARLDLFWTIPYVVLLGALSFGVRKQSDSDVRETKDHRSFGLLVIYLSPVVFTLTIVLMGIAVAKKHPLLAFICISTAVALYGLRSALLQGMYLRTQAELTDTAYCLVQANDRLLSLSTRDGLTGIHNRRHFDEVVMREWKLAARSKECLALLMIDVDCFKALNDRYGHQEGDDCLRRIAAELQAKVKRPSDLVARYGGEEFVVVLPGSNLNGAMAVAEEIRQSVARLALPNEGSVVGRVVTVSVGVSSTKPIVEKHVNELIEQADRALYQAKTCGRNRCSAEGERIGVASHASNSSL